MKKLFAWIGKTIRSLVSDGVNLLEDKGPLAVRITQKIKEAIEQYDGTVSWLVKLTATEKDDEVYEFIKYKLPALIKEIAVVDGLVNDRMSNEGAVKVYTDYILNKTPEGRGKEWANMAGEVLMAIVMKKYPKALVLLVTQKAYTLLFGKKN